MWNRCNQTKRGEREVKERKKGVMEQVVYARMMFERIRVL